MKRKGFHYSAKSTGGDLYKHGLLNGVNLTKINLFTMRTLLALLLSYVHIATHPPEKFNICCDLERVSPTWRTPLFHCFLVAFLQDYSVNISRSTSRPGKVLEILTQFPRISGLFDYLSQFFPANPHLALTIRFKSWMQLRKTDRGTLLLNSQFIPIQFDIFLIKRKFAQKYYAKWRAYVIETVFQYTYFSWRIM